MATDVPMPKLGLTMEEAMINSRNRSWIPVIDLAAGKGPVVVAFGDRTGDGAGGANGAAARDAATGVVRLRAHDPDASLAFYRDLLGFTPHPHPGHLADGVVRLARGQVVVEVVGAPSSVGAGGGPAPVVELHLEVDDAGSIREAAGGAADDGAFVVVDPDGVVVRVTERRA